MLAATSPARHTHLNRPDIIQLKMSILDVRDRQVWNRAHRLRWELPAQGHAGRDLADAVEPDLPLRRPTAPRALTNTTVTKACEFQPRRRRSHRC